MTKTKTIKPETTELSVDQAFEVESALALMIKKEGHGFGYELNFNLSKVRGFLKSWRERLEEYKNSKYEKDLEGNDLIFVVDASSSSIVKTKDVPVVLVNKKGTAGEGFFEVLEVIEGQGTAKRFNPKETEAIDATLEKFKEEKFEVKFKHFDEEDLDQAFKNKAFDGCDLTSLFGILLF